MANGYLHLNYLELKMNLAFGRKGDLICIKVFKRAHSSSPVKNYWLSFDWLLTQPDAYMAMFHVHVFVRLI